MANVTLFVIVFLAGGTLASFDPFPLWTTKDNAECQACIYVVTAVEKYLVDDRTLKEFEDLLDHVCYLLPDVYKGPCKFLVDNYIPQIVSLLEAEFTPEVVCETFSACSPSSDVSKWTRMNFGGVECSGCQYVIKLLYVYISRNSTEMELEKMLEKVCPLLPAAEQAACEALVQYVPTMVTMFENEFPPLDLCADMGFCGNAVLHEIQEVGKSS